MAQVILTESGLPAFPNKTPSVHGATPYVMHFRLALFVYKRLFGFFAPALRTSNMNDGANWMLNGEDATLACGSENQISGLVAYLDTLRESEKGTAASLRGRIDGLQKSFEKMIGDLDYAIASS